MTQPLRKYDESINSTDEDRNGKWKKKIFTEYCMYVKPMSMHRTSNALNKSATIMSHRK